MPAPDHTPAGPLDGIRVIDLTTILLGPMATQILGDMGADVIKVEAPGGDATRALGPSPLAGMGAVFLNTNRNKRSLVLDLKQAAARDALLRLVASADVFVHNMRPQAISRLRLTHEDLAEANPALVYCGTYGYRAAGPYGNKAAYDDMIQAASGLAVLQGGDAGPRYVNSVVADKVTALAVVQSVAMALFHRERTGEGQAIEVPMFETLVAFTLMEHLYGRVFEPPRGATRYPRVLSPGRRPYPTRDGYIAVLPYSDANWREFFALAGHPELAEDARYRTFADRQHNVDALYAELAALLATRTTAAWLDDLDAANIPAMVVNDPDDLVTDPHLQAVGFWRFEEHPALGMLRLPDIPQRFSRTPGSIRRLAPLLGEHSVPVLSELGLSEDEIAAMLAAGATAEP